MQFCKHGRWNGRRQKTLVRASSFWHIQEFKGLQQEHEFTSFFYASKCFILWCFFVKNILGLCCRLLSYTSVLISKTMLVSLLRTSVSKCDQMINRKENQRCNELFWWKDCDFNLFCFLQIYRRKIICWHNYRQPTLGAKRENFHDTEKYETDDVNQEAQAGA